MKPLMHLNLVERAQLLHDLFPEEIPKLVSYIDGMCAVIIEDQEQSRASWSNGLISFDGWLNLATEIQAIIKKHGKLLYKRHSLFATELFGWTKGLVSAHCLIVYVTTQQLPNPKFKAMIEILFDQSASA
jgi:flavorubredoxin